MKSVRLFLFSVFCLIGSSGLFAARQSEDSIRLSPEFLRELDSAFSLQPQQSADLMSIHPRTLDQQQLHEWIGPLKIDPKMPALSGTASISIPGLSPAEMLKASYAWKHGQYGILLANPATGSAGAFSGLDINALGKYIRPKEIEQRKSRTLAVKAKTIMDQLYPTEGPALYCKVDTLGVK